MSLSSEGIKNVLMKTLSGAKFRGRYIQALCPFHADTEPSFAFYLDSMRYVCFACGAKGNVKQLFDHLHITASVGDITPIRQHIPTGTFVPSPVDSHHLYDLTVRYFENLHKVRVDEYATIRKIEENENHGYWLSRGISTDTLAKMNIGCGEDRRGFFYSVPYWWIDMGKTYNDWKNYKVVAIKKIYPHKTEGKKDSYAMYPQGITLPLYHEPALVYARVNKIPVTIFEGEKDVLMAVEKKVLGIGLPGKNAMKESFVSLFKGVPEINLWLDNDANDEMDTIRRMFHRRLPQIRIKKFAWKTMPNLPKGADYTDYVHAHGAVAGTVM